MDWIRQTDSNEVFGEWLKHECKNRSDFKMQVDAQIPQHVQLIENPDYSDPDASLKRYSILRAYRPFVESLRDAEWWVVTVEESDIVRLRLIDSGDWREISGGTLNPIDAARRINDDKSLGTGAHSRQLKHILDHYRKDAISPSKSTLVGFGRTGQFTVVDGVHRIVGTALYYFLRRHEPFVAKEAYVGLTSAPFTLRFA